MLLARHASAATAFLLVAASSPARADYTVLMAAFAEAVSSKSLDAAKRIENSIYLDDPCSANDDGIKERLAAFEVALLGDPALPAATLDAVSADLRPAGRLRDWTTAALAAELRRHRFLRGGLCGGGHLLGRPRRLPRLAERRGRPPAGRRGAGALLAAASAGAQPDGAGRRRDARHEPRLTAGRTARWTLSGSGSPASPSSSRPGPRASTARATSAPATCGSSAACRRRPGTGRGSSCCTSREPSPSPAAPR